MQEKEKRAHVCARIVLGLGEVEDIALEQLGWRMDSLGCSTGPAEGKQGRGRRKEEEKAQQLRIERSDRLPLLTAARRQPRWVG
jgi:hypothetical protein